VTVHGDAVQAWDPLRQETLYPVIGDPLSTGVAHLICTLLFDLIADGLVGASGVVAGVTLWEGLDSTESPISFIAATWNE
jgi:hypothetical protein